MRIIRQDDRLQVGGIEDLGAAQVHAFVAAIFPHLSTAPCRILLDLSATVYLDCAGIGALLALQKRARQLNPKAIVQLLNPTEPARRLLELLGLRRSLTETRGLPATDLEPAALAAQSAPICAEAQCLPT